MLLDRNIIDMKLFELQDEFVKTIIRDTIETYSGQWRLVHEAIQNSHDAIQQNNGIKTGRIIIELYLGSNKVIIRDNGTGIAIEKFQNLFILGGTDKALVKEEMKRILKGSQGVGIKSTLFTSKYFKIETVHCDYTWSYEKRDCYKFNDDDFNPEIQEPTPIQTNLPTGTTVTYSLSDFSVQDFLSELAKEYCDETATRDDDKNEIKDERELKIAIETYFRTKTYLGCTNAMLGINDALKGIDVQVILYFDAESREQHQEMEVERCLFLSNPSFYRKNLTLNFPGKYIDLLELHTNLPRSEQVDMLFDDFEQIIVNKPEAYKMKVLIQKFSKDNITRLFDRPKRKGGRTIFEADEILLKKHKAVLEKINGMYLAIGSKTYMNKFFHIGIKQIISVNGLPTNITLKLPTGALSYLNNVHIVLDVNYTLGFGKRNLNPRYKGYIDAFFLEVWNLLRNVAPYVVGDRDGRDIPESQAWNKEEEIETYNHKQNFMKELPLFFRTVPQEEQEVIALFFELIGRKLLKGYFPFRIASKKTYDGLFYIDYEEGDKLIPNVRPPQLRVVEFKYHLSELIKDFEDENKYIQDIDLLVCWDHDYDADSSYSVSSLERDGIKKVFPGATLRIKKGSDSCQVLVLKDFIQSLEFGRVRTELSPRAYS